MYASIEDFEILARELDAIADEMGGPHGSKRLSELSGYRIADFLRARASQTRTSLATTRRRCSGAPAEAHRRRNGAHALLQ